MKTDKRSMPRFAICVDSSEYPASLELPRVTVRALNKSFARSGQHAG